MNQWMGAERNADAKARSDLGDNCQIIALRRFPAAGWTQVNSSLRMVCKKLTIAFLLFIEFVIRFQSSNTLSLSLLNRAELCAARALWPPSLRGLTADPRKRAGSPRQ